MYNLHRSNVLLGLSTIDGARGGLLPARGGVQAVQQAARSALENSRLCGEPQMRDTGAAGPMSESIASGASFNMGSAVPVAEPEWSAAHRSA